jgi:hypothetical protein
MEDMMTTSTSANPSVQSGVESRVLQEGYGPGAWHGPDLKAALSDVTPELAYRRPAVGRHNIAEVALHHAYYVRSVRAQISGLPAEPFVMPGEDWFAVNDPNTIAWPRVLATVDEEQRRLADLVSDVEAGRTASAVSETDRFGLVLGITCHAVYHAGQVQLVKRLLDASR